MRRCIIASLFVVILLISASPTVALAEEEPGKPWRPDEPFADSYDHEYSEPEWGLDEPYGPPPGEDPYGPPVGEDPFAGRVDYNDYIGRIPEYYP